jgi:hypothetical protein
MKPKKHPVLQIIHPQKTRSITKEKITRLLTSLVPFCFFEADYMAMRYIKPSKKMDLRLLQALKTRILEKRKFTRLVTSLVQFWLFVADYLKKQTT